MDNVIQFFQNFGIYCKNAASTWGYNILVPLATLAVIWLLTFVGLKLFVKKEKLKSVFLIHRAIIIASLIAATVLVAIICYCWSKNLFAYTHAELSFIISLILAFIVPIVSLWLLRGYYKKERMNEIIGQSISAKQASDNISVIRKAYSKNKIWYLLPLAGFLFLLFSLNAGKNLISLVFDNSSSMESANSYNALDKTFGKLENNNEILITTLNGLNESNYGEKKKTMKDIMNIKSSSKLKAGKNYSFGTSREAKNNLLSVLQTESYSSPICEAIWKMWLFTKETKSNADYKHKLLILITDGDENGVEDSNYSTFFYNNEEFTNYYAPENTYIIDYSTEENNRALLQKFENEGVTIYNGITNVEDYLTALNSVLLSFQKNIYLIAWIIAIYIIFAIFGLCITPKNISL